MKKTKLVGEYQCYISIGDLKDLEIEIKDFKKRFPADEYKVTAVEEFLNFFAYKHESDKEYKARLDDERLKREAELYHQKEVDKKLEETMMKKIMTRGLRAVAVCSCFSCGYEKHLLENEVVEDCLNCGSNKFQIKTAIVGSEK